MLNADAAHRYIRELLLSTFYQMIPLLFMMVDILISIHHLGIFPDMSMCPDCPVKLNKLYREQTVSFM